MSDKALEKLILEVFWEMVRRGYISRMAEWPGIVELKYTIEDYGTAEMQAAFEAGTMSVMDWRICIEKAILILNRYTTRR